jgi:hypothetical protein
MASRMSNRSGGSKFSKSPKSRLEDSRMTYKEDPTGMQTIKQWQKVPEVNIDLLATSKIQRHFLRHNSPSVELNTKDKLAYSERGYRTREQYNKIN